MMRILTVVHWLNRGGIEVQLLHALEGLTQRGIEMDVCCTGPAGVLDDEFARHGCRIHRIKKSVNCYVTARQLQQVLADNRYAAVHSHLGHTSGGICLGAARSRVPIAVSLHSAMPLSLYRIRNAPLLGQMRQAWLTWHKRLIARFAGIVVGHSETNLSAFAPDWRRQSDRCRVVHNGVCFYDGKWTRGAARRNLGIDDRSTAILHVGTLKEEKNHSGLLEIFERIVAARPEARLILVGDGPLRPVVEAEAARRGLAGRVQFAGTQADVWKYYSAADLLVFPSHTEGFGNVVAEAQSARLRVVASDIPALRESVAPDQRRFLFPLPRYDRAAELALEQLAAGRLGVDDWLATSDAFVRQRFSVDRFTHDLATLYRDLAA